MKAHKVLIGMMDLTPEVAVLGGGPLSMSEADLAALETQGRDLVAAGKLVYEHMRHCDVYGSMDQLQAIETLLKYIGIWDKVVPQPITQPQAEMACHGDDPEAFINHSTPHWR